MEEPLQVARDTEFVRSQPGFAEFERARNALDAAVSMADCPERQEAALILSRDAALIAIQASSLRQGGKPAQFAAELWQSALSFPQLSKVVASWTQPDREKLAQLADGLSGAPLIGLASAERNRLRGAFQRVTRELLEALERDATQVTRLGVQRSLRWFAVLASLALVAGAAAVTLARVQHAPNLAAGREVTLSSYHVRDSYPPEALVDGVRSEIGCYTESEDNPWAQIDLGAVKTVNRIVVTNRLDRNQKKALPLVIEVSADGKKFNLYARRDEPFSVWESNPDPVAARYVKLSVAKRSELHLNEVEVY